MFSRKGQMFRKDRKCVMCFRNFHLKLIKYIFNFLIISIFEHIQKWKK